MEWTALIGIFNGKSALYGMVTDKKVKYKNEEQNGKNSARVNINLLDLDEAVLGLGLLLYWGRLQKINKLYISKNEYFY